MEMEEVRSIWRVWRQGGKRQNVIILISKNKEQNNHEVLKIILE